MSPLVRTPTNLRLLRRSRRIDRASAGAVCVALALLTTACTGSTSSAPPPAGTAPPSEAGADGDPLACTLAATRGAPRLTPDQAQALVGGDVTACKISAGSPAATALVIPASRTRIDHWAELISFSTLPVPSGYTESRFTHIYLQVGHQWRLGRALGQGANA